jgi:hypothetical protein
MNMKHFNTLLHISLQPDHQICHRTCRFNTNDIKVYPGYDTGLVPSTSYTNPYFLKMYAFIDLIPTTLSSNLPLPDRLSSKILYFLSPPSATSLIQHNLLDLITLTIPGKSYLVILTPSSYQAWAELKIYLFSDLFSFHKNRMLAGLASVYLWWQEERSCPYQESHFSHLTTWEQLFQPSQAYITDATVEVQETNNFWKVFRKYLFFKLYKYD